ncbi:MAG: YfhO family protein [Chloroflexota bacterium]|nr:YfhO family protein [Chloroflexota bacterium]
MKPLLPLTLALPAAGLALLVLALLGYQARRDPRRIPLFHEVAALLTLAGLVAGFFWRPLFTHDSWLPIGGGDLASFFYPLYTFIHASIQAGQFPLWNPYAFAGMPLAADVQSGLFYPPNVLTWLVVPAGRYGYGTLETLLIAHYAWAALGMYRWLRALDLRRVATLGGAAAFAFCGFMTAHFGHLPLIFTAAWLPWNLLLAHRAATSPNPAWIAPAGAALGLTFLAGHPQTFLYEALAVGLYWASLALTGATVPAAIGLAARRPLALLPVAWRSVAWRLPIVALIAAGLGLVQFLPAQELAGQSLRAGITYEQATEHAMQPVGLLNLVLPRVYGANPRDYWVPWQSTENWGYLGLIVLILAAAGLILRRDRRLGFPVALAVLALLGMLGPFSILFSWLHGLTPGFDKFRAAGRLLLLLSVAVAGWAAFGLDTLLRLLPDLSPQPPPLRREGESDGPAPGSVPNSEIRNQKSELARLRRFAGGLGALAAFAALVLLPLVSAIFLAGNSIERGQIVLNDVYTAVLWLGLAAGLLGAAVRGRIGGRWAVLGLAVLLVLDLFSPNSHFNPTGDDLLTGYAQPDALDLLRSGTGAPAYYRMDSDTDVSPVWQPLLGTLAGIPDAGGLYNPLELRRYSVYWDAAKAHRNTVLYDLLSVRYTLALSPTLISDPKFQRVGTGANGVLIAENIHADPRLFLVHDAVVEPDDATVIGKLLNGTVLGWHSILLAAGTGRSSKTPSTLEAGNPGESATITRYTPNEIAATLDVREAGWAVLSDNWYPGWTATLDGQAVPVQRADTIFRAVPVPPGKHLLVLRFLPTDLFTGGALSAVTALLTLIGGLVAWSRQRRGGQRVAALV